MSNPTPQEVMRMKSILEKFLKQSASGTFMKEEEKSARAIKAAQVLSDEGSHSAQAMEKAMKVLLEDY